MLNDQYRSVFRFRSGRNVQRNNKKKLIRDQRVIIISIQSYDCDEISQVE